MKHIVMIMLLAAAPLAAAQTPSSVRFGYPDGGFVEIVADENYCLKRVSVNLKGAHIDRQEVEGHFCNLHLQEAVVRGESSINLLTGKGGFGWEIDIPYGISDENFSTEGGRYRLVLGRSRIERITALPTEK